MRLVLDVCGCWKAKAAAGPASPPLPGSPQQPDIRPQSLAGCKGLIAAYSALLTTCTSAAAAPCSTWILCAYLCEGAAAAFCRVPRL